MSEMKQQLVQQPQVHEQQQQQQDRQHKQQLQQLALQEILQQKRDRELAATELSSDESEPGQDEEEANNEEETEETDEETQQQKAMALPLCNRFLLKDQPDFETPKRIYAVLDQAELSPDGAHQFMFGGLGAAVFDQQLAEISSRADAGDFEAIFEQMPLFLLELKLSARALIRLHAGNTTELTEDDQEPGDPGGMDEIQTAIEELEGRWIEFSLEGTGASATGVLYRNLFGDPQPTAIAMATTPGSGALQALSRIDPLDGQRDATQTEIEAALAPAVGSLDEIAIYDVGQGSSCGLLSNGRVATYFDFGGGVAGNKKTFPRKLVSFCFCRTEMPPIILSHWDHDHWSSEGRDTRSHGATWIAPRQPITGRARAPHHSAFIASLISNGKLLIWPAKLSSLAVGQFRIIKCVGTSKNASGLAVEVDPPDDTHAPVLLPADAGYDDIPGASSGTFEGIACPHHGGWSNFKNVPTKPSPRHSRLAYSYGRNNTYHHPLSATYTAHNNASWTDPRVTKQSAPCYVRNTEDRSANKLGHIGFNWGKKSRPTKPPCSGACYLGIQQY